MEFFEDTELELAFRLHVYYDAGLGAYTLGVDKTPIYGEGKTLQECIEQLFENAQEIAECTTEEEAKMFAKEFFSFSDLSNFLKACRLSLKEE